MTTDYFAHKAADFEQNPRRVDNVARIAETIVNRVRLDKAMHLMDFGSGTGLLLERMAPRVGRITAVDVSPAMNQQLRDKLDRLECPVELRQMDLERDALAETFDGIISSMTLHHIRDIAGLFAKFHALLHADGFIALADLDTEDGSFHSEDTGVHHQGFDRAALAEIARGAGFHAVETHSASVISKAQRDYPVFVLIAYRSMPSA